MMKWDEPKPPVPSWLDADREVVHDDPKLERSAFIVTCVDQLLKLPIGLSIAQALGVVANSLNETGWGQFYRANNLGGWKITKAGAAAFRAAHGGQGPKWWRAPGNRAPDATLTDLKGGDEPWCYYRAFSSIGEYLAEWVAHFVPKPGNPIPWPLYATTGALFWAGSPDWFHAMCQAGYKGENTKHHPEGACVEHEQLVRAASTRWAQSKLSVVADGKWGDASRACCLAFQQSHGVTPTGILDMPTLEALAAYVRAAASP